LRVGGLRRTAVSWCIRNIAIRKTQSYCAIAVFLGKIGAVWLLCRTRRVFVNAELSTAGWRPVPFTVSKLLVIDWTLRIPALTRDSPVWVL
jgi:hypothetical protein